MVRNVIAVIAGVIFGGFVAIIIQLFLMAVLPGDPVISINNSDNFRRSIVVVNSVCAVLGGVFFYHRYKKKE